MTDECACGHKREDHGDLGCQRCDIHPRPNCDEFTTPALRDARADENAKRAAYIEAIVALRAHGARRGGRLEFERRSKEFAAALELTIAAEVEARA